MHPRVALHLWRAKRENTVSNGSSFHLESTIISCMSMFLSLLGVFVQLICAFVEKLQWYCASSSLLSYQQQIESSIEQCKARRATDVPKNSSRNHFGTSFGKNICDCHIWSNDRWLNLSAVCWWGDFSMQPKQPKESGWIGWRMFWKVSFVSPGNQASDKIWQNSRDHLQQKLWPRRRLWCLRDPTKINTEASGFCLSRS